MSVCRSGIPRDVPDSYRICPRPAMSRAEADDLGVRPIFCREHAEQLARVRDSMQRRLRTPAPEKPADDAPKVDGRVEANARAAAEAEQRARDVASRMIPVVRERGRVTGPDLAAAVGLRPGRAFARALSVARQRGDLDVVRGGSRGGFVLGEAFAEDFARRIAAAVHEGGSLTRAQARDLLPNATARVLAAALAVARERRWIVAQPGDRAGFTPGDERPPQPEQPQQPEQPERP